MRWASRTVFLNEQLSMGPAPEGLNEYLTQAVALMVSAYPTDPGTGWRLRRICADRLDEPRLRP